MTDLFELMTPAEHKKWLADQKKQERREKSVNRHEWKPWRCRGCGGIEWKHWPPFSGRKDVGDHDHCLECRKTTEWFSDLPAPGESVALRKGDKLPKRLSMSVLTLGREDQYNREI